MIEIVENIASNLKWQKGIKLKRALWGGGGGGFDLTSLPPSILNSGCHIFWLTNLKKMVGRIVKIFEKPPPKKISAHATASLVYFLSAVIIAFVGDEIILAY